ncbi:MAG: hypothetical protein HC866_10225 [Leptolyngbyaceae cyanobacterium RU_5_1]|nr:hypothetical protein [Leptolyngbyaceae cyanobacterium RU_5_1]
MNTSLERAGELKQALSDFVLDAEGELAVALETFSAAQLSRSQQQDMHRRSLVVDRFLVEGKVGDKPPIELFLENEPDLSECDRALIQSWHHSFVGLFEITQILDDGFELMNWTTAKRYVVKPTEPSALKAMARLKMGEILLTQIAPVTEDDWMFFSPWTAFGKLGKPKLAVAIGNFKQNYKPYLYSDAPELLAEAWRSVEQYYQDFINFFGGDEVTLPGYQLGKKLTEFQDMMTQKQFEAAGFDRSKSLAELVEESGTSKEEIVAAAEAMGADQKTVAQVFENQGRSQKMAAPQVELPTHLKNAEQVTALTHPRWGQLFLPTYSQFKALLEADDWRSIPNAEKLMHQYLENPEINRSIWYRLAQHYSVQLETILRDFLECPNFNLGSDLDAVLNEFNKPLEAELPEIASVPLHLHNLFQDAVLEVSKEKSKTKSKKQKAGTGFK